MRKVINILFVIIVTGLFGYAIATIEPYPHTHDLHVFLISSICFLCVLVWLRSREERLRLLKYGLAVFACREFADFWYFYGSMQRGWWYPPQLPIVQQFCIVDGEAAHDARVSNLFLSLWLAVTMAFGCRFLFTRAQGGSSRKRRLKPALSRE
jgi:hypothetical protein